MSTEALNLVRVAGNKYGCDVSSFGLDENKQCCCILYHLKGFEEAGWEAQQ